MIAALALLAAAAVVDPSATPAVPVAPPAPTPVTTTPAATAKPHDYGDKMVCKSIANTGTRFTTRDCRTQAEWSQLSADSKQATWDATLRQAGGPKP